MATAVQPLIFRWGIISTGQIATKFVKDLLIDAKTRDVYDITHRITAVGSRSYSSAERFIREVVTGNGAESSNIKAYGTYEEVFADGDVDAVYIGTPHTAHYPPAFAALRAGKHVLLEKPATANAAELRALLDAARAGGVFLMEAMWTRFLPVVTEFKAVAEEGRLGEVKGMWADLGGDFDIENIPTTHRAIDPLQGGGSLLDLGPYPFVWAIIALYEHPSNRLARPSHISGSMVKTPRTGVDMAASFTLTFDPTVAPFASRHSVKDDSESKVEGVKPTMAAQAILSTSITRDSQNPAVIVRYEHGTITIPSPSFAPREFTVTYDAQINTTADPHPSPSFPAETKTVKVSWEGGGWHFQADEVARCVRDGKSESDVWGWEKSLLEMEVFDEVRRAGGYMFPEGVEHVI